MTKTITESGCVGCGVKPCMNCPDIEITIHCCDRCEDDSYVLYKVDDEELCEDCAYEKLATKEKLQEFIASEKELTVDFWLNWVMNCKFDCMDLEKISDTLIDSITNDLTRDNESTISEWMYDYAKKDKAEFLTFLDIPIIDNE